MTLEHRPERGRALPSAAVILAILLLPATARAQDVTTGDAVADAADNAAGQTDVDINFDTADGEGVGGNWIAVSENSANAIRGDGDNLGFLTVLGRSMVNRVFVPAGMTAQSRSDEQPTISLLGDTGYDFTLDGLPLEDSFYLEIRGTVVAPELAEAILIDNSIGNVNAVHLHGGADVSGVVKSIGDSAEYFLVAAKPTGANPVTSQLTGTLDLGPGEDLLLIEAVATGTNTGLATAQILNNVIMGPVNDERDAINITADGKAIAQIVGNVTSYGETNLEVVAHGRSASIATARIAGLVRLGNGDDRVFLVVSADSGSDGADVHINGDILLGNGENLLWLQGNDFTIGRIAINDDADGSGTNHTIFGGAGSDTVRIHEAPRVYANINLAQYFGGSDLIELDTSVLNGTVSFGRTASTLETIGDAGSTINGSVIARGPLTIVTTPSLQITGRIRIDPDGHVTVMDADDLTVTGGIVDPEGDGFLTINDGTLNTTDTPLLGEIDLTVDAPAVLRLGGAQSLRALSGAGRVNAAAHDLTLARGTGSFAGQLLSADDLVVSSGSHTFSGNNTITGNVDIDGGLLAFSGTNTIGGDVNLNAGSLLSNATGLGSADIIMQPGATLGAATADGLSLSAAGRLDLSAIDADGEGIRLNPQRGQMIVSDWTLPAAGGATFTIGATNDTGDAALRDLALDAGGTAETLRVNTGAIRLIDSVTMGAGDVIDAADGAQLILDAPVPGAGTVGPGDGQLFYGPNVDLMAYTLGPQVGLASGLGVDNIVTGNVTITGNTTFIGNGGIDLRGDIDMGAGNLTLEVFPTTTLTLTGPVTAGGPITKNGDGTLVLDTSLPTSLIVSGGRADINALVDGDLIANDGTTVRLAGDFVGDDLIVTGATITPLVDVTVPGSLQATQLTIGASSNRLTILGPATFGSGPLTISGASGLELGGNITGDITKQGAGTLYINDLDSDGRGALGDVAILAGTLAGDGPIRGDLAVGDNARHTPGNSLGDPIRVGGDYTLSGILEVDIDTNDPRRNDKIVADGHVTLDGSVIRVVTGVGLEQYDTFTIIEADADDSGDRLLVDGVTIESLVSYDFIGEPSGNTYVIQALRQPIARFAANANELGIARVIDQMNNNELTDALGVLPASQFSAAIRQLNPEPFTILPATLRGTIGQINGRIAGQLMSRRAGLTRPWADEGWVGLPALSLQYAQAAQDPWWMGLEAEPRQNRQPDQPQRRQPQRVVDDATPREPLAEMPLVKQDPQWGAWVKGYGLFQDRDTTDDLLGFSADTYGATAGVERELREGATAGLLLSYGYTDQEFDLGRGEADVHSLRVGPYIGLYDAVMFLDASVTAGYHMAEATREISFPGYRRTAESDYDAWDVAFYAGTGFDITTGGLVITPTAAIQFIHYSQSAFEESGAGVASLDVDSWTDQSLTTVLGVRVSRLFALDQADVLLAPEAFVGWSHEFLERDSIGATFVDQPVGFSFDPGTGSGDSVVFGAGLSALIRNSTSLFARYDGALGGDLDAHAVTAGVAIRF